MPPFLFILFGVFILNDDYFFVIYLNFKEFFYDLSIIFLVQINFVFKNK